tara:strand:- start:121 stop:816 length:696 start_codon:yes stop_codon:yes gene_type:complete
MKNDFWNAIFAGAMLGALHGMTVPAMADHAKGHIKGYNSMDAMGCMLLRECTDGVDKIKSIDTIADEYPDSDYSAIATEFNDMLTSLDRVGVEVFLADSKYFPVGHRGVYHTVSNNFFLNRNHVARQGTLMSVMRHEGWHAAQDCMAGTIENSMIAIIKPEEDVPMIWRVLAERTYPEHAVPWEAEAGWAGRTENMTKDALAACAAGEMWKVYPPTPLTKKWLQENNYIAK